jgi:hypothetical protein
VADRAPALITSSQSPVNGTVEPRLKMREAATTFRARMSATRRDVDQPPIPAIKRPTGPSSLFETRYFPLHLAIRCLPPRKGDRLLACFEPRQRRSFLLAAKQLDSRSNHVTGNVRNDLKESAVGHHSDAFDVSMMSRNESEMRQKCPETSPAGE